MNDKYAGTKGNTHGETKEITPAKNAAKTVTSSKYLTFFSQMHRFFSYPDTPGGQVTSSIYSLSRSEIMA